MFPVKSIYKYLLCFSRSIDLTEVCVMANIEKSFTSSDVFAKVDDSRFVQKMRPLQPEPNLQGSDKEEWRKDMLNPDRTNQGIYRTIGARNPYALAERILNTGESPWIAGHPEKNRELLIQIFSQSPKMKKFSAIKYDQLFDPNNKSPLYPETLAMRSGMVTANPRLVQPRVATEVNPCSNTGDYWGIYNVPSTITPANYCNASPRPTKNDVIDDVVQGCAKNCYFIAALCSKAWCSYPAFPVLATTKALQDTYTIRFYYPDGITVRPVTVSSDLVLEKPANSPVFSRPSSSNEVWPAIYEKAYGVFMTLIQSQLPFQGKTACASYPRPDIPKFLGGNALESLEHLTGAKWTMNQTYFNTSTLSPPGDSFTKMNPAISMGTNGHGITSYPMVAWTYPTAVDANNARHNDPKIAYDTEMIVANHSYSILGTVTNNGKNYIVLRNPWGRLWGTDQLRTPYTILPGITWSPPTSPIFSRVLDVKDGIFALEVTQFERYFTAFGWVK